MYIYTQAYGMWENIFLLNWLVSIITGLKSSAKEGNIHCADGATEWGLRQSICQVVRKIGQSFDKPKPALFGKWCEKEKYNRMSVISWHCTVWVGNLSPHMFNELHIPDWHRNYNKTVESLEIWHVGILVMVDKEQEGTGKSLIKNDKLPT